MPPLSGSDKAYKLALAGSARAGSTRAEYFLRDTLPVWINGAARQGLIQSTLTIDLNTGEEPHRASFDFFGGSGFVPQAGHTVVIGHGSTANPVFSGRILIANRSSKRAADRRVIYRCEAAGHMFELNTTRTTLGVSAENVSVSSVVRAILANTSPSASAMGFTADYIDPALPRVDTFNTGPAEELSTALARLFRSVDALWFVDHSRGIRAFGTQDVGPGAVPRTLSVPSAGFWNVNYTATDLSRVFTKVQVLGAIQPTLADVNLATQPRVPIAAASILSNLESVDSDILAGTSEQWLLDGHVFVGSLIYRPEQAFETNIVASTFLDTTVGANTLIAVSRNISSLRPFEDIRWYAIAGQCIYVSSLIGAYSLTASSVAYAYAVPTTGPGALVSDIPALSEVTGLMNAVAVSVPVNRFIPAGSAFQNFVTRINSAAVAEVSSLFGSTAFGLITKTLEDQRLSPDGAAAVASAALDRGAPATWRSIEFETRETAYTIGRPVYASITSVAESGANSVAGAFTVQDVTFSGFDTLTDSGGPIRTVRAGTVRRPTMWQILQGDR